MERMAMVTITDLTGSATLQLGLQIDDGGCTTPSPISRDRPHCSPLDEADPVVDAAITDLTGSATLQQRVRLDLRRLRTAITDLTGSATLQRPVRHRRPPGG